MSGSVEMSPGPKFTPGDPVYHHKRPMVVGRVVREDVKRRRTLVKWGRTSTTWAHTVLLNLVKPAAAAKGAL